MSSTIPKSLRYDHAVAVLVGTLSGILSSLLLRPIFHLEPSLQVFGLPQDVFPMGPSLTLSAGVAFAIVGSLYLLAWKGMRWQSVALFLVSSLIGMFVAAEVAVHLFTMVYGFDSDNFVLAYLGASPVGSAIVLGPLMWRLKPANWRLVLIHGILWPAVWAVGVAIVMVINNAESALEAPWSFMLFCGWQAITLYTLSGLPAQRPHMPLG